MGREVRMVPPDWQHPWDGSYYPSGQKRWTPLFENYRNRVESWDQTFAEQLPLLLASTRKSWSGQIVSLDRRAARRITDEASARAYWEDCDGARPDPKDYMPEWEPGVATHYMMYETVTEGSPVSPAFATPEELARWLAINGDSEGRYPNSGTYESWLAVARGGWAPSGVIMNGTMMSGVDGVHALNKEETTE